ncbi:M16 family metallopeptidase [Polymorphobacter fuscus]|uniref:Insulinase family protein n=1 Tax=Sandarakinorhabdus fusca TaxID=1439888 RepID=A0A7C9GNH1_9SPHN|nr:pitrilysin family protein [Polymorphobacter fuscus]KAB7647495.1 insulinase family protein [Polymorphobacter fuscus]MQT16755.1 insulinase family protein [Polymorphobacter fuscus]NJC09257.1 putative Zn-dependent peptidase [Polymorphobacter fuscus]
MKTPVIAHTAHGLRVATCATPGVETVAVALHADVGARFEAAEDNGLAHLFEHMVFKGTATRSARAIAEEIEDVGGNLNAWTSRDTTVFHARLLARDLPLGIGLIADLVTRPRFDADDLAREKDVVLQELGEARDTPDDIVFDHLQEAAFPGQALGRSILGSEATLDRLTVDDLHGWLASGYRNPRLTLVVAGKVDHAAVMQLAEAVFPNGGESTAPAPEPVAFASGHFADPRRFEQAQLTSGYPAPGHHDPMHDAAALFTMAAGGGMSSRLFQEVRESRGLAYSISAATTAYADGGLMSVHAATARKDAARARDLIDRVLAETAASLSSAELARAKAQAVASLLMALESPQGQGDYVARSLLVHGRHVPPAEIVKRIEAVTVEAARAAGAAMLAHAPARAEIGAAVKTVRRAAA